ALFVLNCNELGTRDPQDGGGTGYDTQNSPELTEPGDSQDGERSDTSGAEEKWKDMTPKDSSELTEDPTESEVRLKPTTEFTNTRWQERVGLHVSGPADSGGLSEEQAQAINSARNMLTEADRDRINRRYVNLFVNAINASDVEEEQGLQEGTSRDKEKGVDPRNWGR
ncbi:hypothetical protein C0992_005915, partial [Termitomyces sp. T32_za158]